MFAAYLLHIIHLQRVAEVLPLLPQKTSAGVCLFSGLFRSKYRLRLGFNFVKTALKQHLNTFEQISLMATKKPPFAPMGGVEGDIPLTQRSFQ